MAHGSITVIAAASLTYIALGAMKAAGRANLENLGCSCHCSRDSWSAAKRSKFSGGMSRDETLRVRI